MKAYLRAAVPCRVSPEGGRELGAGERGATRQQVLGADGDAWGRTEPCTADTRGCGDVTWGVAGTECDIIWHL